MTGAVAYVRGIIPDKANREKDDFYPTPPAGTRALLSVERFDGAIWEPACGDGAIAQELAAAGYPVVATDLVDRGYGAGRVDFLMETRTLAPNIVTNPPFKLAQDFAETALRLTSGQVGAKVAMLARLAWLEGKERRRFFEASPLARVWVFAGRLHMDRGKLPGAGHKGGMIAFAWFVWQHGHAGPPVLGWIEP